VPELLVVVEHSVHVLDPEGVHWAVKHDPLLVGVVVELLLLRGVPVGKGQDAVAPLVSDRIELAAPW
jgi:hypothetical protein